MDTQICATVPCRIDYLDGLIELARSLCRDLDPDVFVAIATALNEAFANVVEHSTLMENDSVTVSARRDGRAITIRIVDEGIAVPSRVADNAKATERPPLQISGMGLHLIQACMDRVQYSRAAGNELVMVKHL